MPTESLVFLIVLLAIFVQTLTGFGLALVSMPLLTAVIGLQLTTPFVAIFGLMAEIILLVYYREALTLRAVGQLVLAALFGVPLGVWLLGNVDADIGTRLLGVIVAGYAVYALVGLTLPQLAHAGWAYGFGFVAGIIAGAFNIAGPPVIIYGNCRRWPPAMFKVNLQGFFVAVSVMVLVGHFSAGNVTTAVWRLVLVAIPAVLLGIVLGVSLDGRIPAATFRKLVLILLLLIGLRLIIT